MGTDWQQHSFGRRRLLQFGAAGIAGLGLGCRPGNSVAQQLGQVGTSSSLMASGDAPLKERASAKGLIYGAATRYYQIDEHPDLAEAYARECAIIVHDAELKMHKSQPEPGQFDFGDADRLIEFARQHDAIVRGHTLVWHNSVPDWVEETIDRGNAEQIMVDHIMTVAGRYAGQMHSWDVVNETIDTGSPDDLRPSVWLDNIGPEYIEIAFRAAAEADPNALLTLNDHRLEYPSRGERKRQTAFLKRIEHLKSRGIPIHAAGLQAHLRGELNDDLEPDNLRQFLRNLADLDLEILITELDVTDQELPYDFEQRDRIVADAYGEYLDVVLDEPAVSTVITWGLSDRFTWLDSAQARPDNAPVRSLPLDDALNRKPAWHAMARAFDNAPGRSIG